MFSVILMSYFVTTLGQTLKFQFNIMEELPNGSLVGSIANKTKPLIQTNYTNLLYDFIKPSDAARMLFSLNDNSGDLFTLVVLDREYLCAYKVDCIYEFDVSIHSGDNRFFKTATVQVIIDDINDNGPIFPVDEVTVKYFENSPLGYAVNIDTATDKDMGANNGIQTYELLADPDSIDVFLLNVSRLKFGGGFVLKLVLNKTLDRETKDNYHVTVVAKDGGNEPKSGSVRITISVQDINDNIPEFASSIYNVSVNESTTVLKTILKLSASDKDLGDNGRVAYRFSEFLNDKEILDHLQLNETTGELKVKTSLTDIAGNTYQVIVEAVDRGVENSLFSQAEVIIHIDDSENNAPIIWVSQLNEGTIGYFNVSENSVEGTFVAYVNVDDPDKGSNGIVECSLSNSNFNIASLDKGFKISVKGLLNREVTDYYNVTVTCFDHGLPAMSSSMNFGVRVTDVNDNTPIFDKLIHIAKLQENNKGNEIILQLSSVDSDEGNNANIHYVADGSAKDRFIVDRNSGVVRVNAIFDREVEQNITFNVLAIDGGEPALTGTASVILIVEDQNDNPPVFIKSVFNFAVKENQATGTDVGKLKAFDLDSGINAAFDFSISPDYINQVPFILFPDGLLKVNMQLDCEQASKYDFTVIVTDHGENHLSSMAQVTVRVIDLNDNYPIVTYPTPSNNTVIVWYPDFVDTYVTTVQAYDLDEGANKELQYSIIAGNDRKIFRIDSVNGTIFLDSQSDTGSDLTVKLDISVKDKGDQPLETLATLFIELKYTNASFLAIVQSESNKYIIISVVVVIATLITSAVIIGVILFLQKLDKKRKLKETNGASTTNESDSGFVFVIQTQNVTPADMLTSEYQDFYDPIKKKEVSFVIDSNDSFDYHQQINGISSFSTKPFKSPLRYSAHVATDTIQNNHQNEANVQLQSIKDKQILLQNRAKQWVQQQQQHYTLAPDDHHSEGSTETNCSDSGRGCSEEEDVFSTRSGDDPKSFDISTPESQTSTYMLSQTNVGTHTAVPVQTTTGSYVDMSWTCKPHLALKDCKSRCSDHTLNRNFNFKRALHTTHVGSVSSIYSNIVQTQPSWGGTYYGSGLSVDFSGDSAIHSVFDKTSVMITSRDDDDSYSTTTSGSYTLNSEDIL